MSERVGKLPDQPSGRGPNGRPFCRGCGKEVTGRRQSWCSDGCVREAMIRAFPSSARDAVERRDKGVCAACGFDTERARSVLWRLRHRHEKAKQRADEAELREVWLFLRVLWGGTTKWEKANNYVPMGWHIPHLWEADHIVPVIEGGGGCGLENYRTLCRTCHNAATKELRGRMSRRRRMPLFEEAMAQ